MSHGSSRTTMIPMCQGREPDIRRSYHWDRESQNHSALGCKTDQPCCYFGNYQGECIHQLPPCNSHLAITLRKGEGFKLSKIKFPFLAEWEFIIEIKENYREINKITFLKVFFMLTIFKVFIEFLNHIASAVDVLVFWSWGMRDLSFSNRDRTLSTCIERWSPNYWTSREFPKSHFLRT